MFLLKTARTFREWHWVLNLTHETLETRIVFHFQKERKKRTVAHFLKLPFVLSYYFLSLPLQEKHVIGHFISQLALEDNGYGCYCSETRAICNSKWVKNFEENISFTFVRIVFLLSRIRFEFSSSISNFL